MRMYTIHCKSKKKPRYVNHTCIYSLQDDGEVSAASATPLSREGTIYICIYFVSHCFSLYVEI